MLWFWLDEFSGWMPHTGCQCTTTFCNCYGADVTGTTTTPVPSSNRIVVVIDRYRESFEIKAELRIAPAYDPPPRYSAVDASRLRRTRSPRLACLAFTRAVPAGRERGHAFGHSPRVRSRHGG